MNTYALMAGGAAAVRRLIKIWNLPAGKTHVIFGSNYVARGPL